MISKKHILYILFGLSACSVHAQSSLQETRTVVEKWVETRQLTSRLKADWQVEKDVLERSLRAFERELSTIDVQLENVADGKTQVAIQIETTSKEKESLTDYSGRLQEEIERLEGRLKQLASQLPSGVQERISPLMDRLPENSKETKRSLSTRMQHVLGVINELNKFNSSVTVVSELRQNDAGAEVQVQVLYVGLAQAYFTDQTGAFAGTGKPGATGWKWSNQAELGKKILDAIAIYQGSQPAAFVRLPLELK